MNDLKGVQIEKTYFYTDSSAVLGYLRNETSCFSRYITRRIEAVHRLTDNEQWHFVATSDNPADVATRPQTSVQLLESNWIPGPAFLRVEPLNVIAGPDKLQTLPETIPKVTVLAADIQGIESDAWIGRVRSYHVSFLLHMLKCPF